MKLTKQAGLTQGGTPDKEMLEKINLQSRKPLKAEEVYAFSMRLCDDQIDRDGERFATEALPGLAELFIGKPGIVDHNWSAEKQAARIFDTEVVSEPGVSWLKAWAYIPRAGREGLIADIEAGIRREVSISCSMGRRYCSICGSEIGTCGHRSGEVYEGQLCAGVLAEPRDAYEFSFVAVPAQPCAGVVKHWKGGEEMKLGEFVEKSGSDSVKQEYKRLTELAQVGKAHRARLEAEIVRMGTALELGLDGESLGLVIKTLDITALQRFHDGLEKKLEAQFGGGVQLEAPRMESGEDAFLI